VAQHFLMSAAARTLSLVDLCDLSEEAAHQMFRRMRWPDTEGAPVCPNCSCAAVYTYRCRRVFKCKACCRQFSATSGTLLAYRKLPVRISLMAFSLFVNAASRMLRDLLALEGSAGDAATKHASCKRLWNNCLRLPRRRRIEPGELRNSFIFSVIALGVGERMMKRIGMPTSDRSCAISSGEQRNGARKQTFEWLGSMTGRGARAPLTEPSSWTWSGGK
jgi:hypothetical protein